LKGASEGKGLGLRFLRHIERNSLLLFLVPADADDIVKQYHILVNELEQYNPELVTKDRILAISKCDLIDDELQKMLEKDVKKKLKAAGEQTGKTGLPIVFFSSATQFHLDKLKDEIMKLLDGKK
jgi:GTP-binding protein